MAFQGNNLRTLREDRAWSIAELAKRADLNRMDVSRYEKGREPPPDRAVALSRALGVHPSELDPVYADPIFYDRPARHPCIGKPKWLRDFCRIFHALPEGELSIIRAAAQAAVKKSTRTHNPQNPQARLVG